MKKITFTGTSLFAALVLFLSACNQPTTPTSKESSAAPLETAISSTAPTTTAEETSPSTTTTSATTTLTPTKSLTQKPTQNKAPTKKPTTKVPAPTEDQQQAALARYNAAMQKVLSRKVMHTCTETAMDMSFGGITVHMQGVEELRISDNDPARGLLRNSTATVGGNTFEMKEYMGNGYHYLYSTEYPEQNSARSITDAELSAGIKEVFNTAVLFQESDIASIEADGEC